MPRPRKYPPELLESRRSGSDRVWPADRARCAPISACRRKRCDGICARSGADQGLRPGSADQ